MEVQKLLFIFAIAALMQACSAKTSTDVFNPSSQAASSCANARIPGQYLVRWEDGRVTLETGDSDESFIQGFIDPNLEKIRRVEHNLKIQVPVTVPSEAATQDEPDFVAKNVVVNNWGQQMIQADSVWLNGQRGSGVPVAVVDTPIDINHSLLRNRILLDSQGNFGWDFSENAPAQAAVQSSHGSHVAGVVASEHSSTLKLGVAPDARIIIGSFLGDDGGGDLPGAIQALKYARDRGAKIINASWGGKDCSITLRETIQEISDAGIIVVVASGNDGRDLDSQPDYPAVYEIENQITVAAVRSSGQLESFSNTSYRFVHLAAPGVEIFSTITRNGLGYMSGTSMAAPFVSGAAAVLWGHRPQATAGQIKAALLTSVDRGNYRVSTQGRLNLRKAVLEIERLVP